MGELLEDKAKLFSIHLTSRLELPSEPLRYHELSSGYHWICWPGLCHSSISSLKSCIRPLYSTLEPTQYVPCTTVLHGAITWFALMMMMMMIVMNQL